MVHDLNFIYKLASVASSCPKVRHHLFIPFDQVRFCSASSLLLGEYFCLSHYLPPSSRSGHRIKSLDEGLPYPIALKSSLATLSLFSWWALKKQAHEHKQQNPKLLRNPSWTKAFAAHTILHKHTYHRACRSSWSYNLKVKRANETVDSSSFFN